MSFQNTWETFLRLTPLVDRAPDADSAWLVARGVASESPLVLRCVVDDVGGLVRELGDRLEWYAFLVHDHNSGVPTTGEDYSSYLHVRLSLVDDGDLALPKQWSMTRRQQLSREIAGVDASALVDGIDAAWRILGQQSALFLSLLEQHKTDADPVQRLVHVRQFLHFFSNMAQMRVA